MRCKIVNFSNIAPLTFEATMTPKNIKRNNFTCNGGQFESQNIFRIFGSPIVYSPIINHFPDATLSFQRNCIKIN